MDSETLLRDPSLPHPHYPFPLVTVPVTHGKYSDLDTIGDFVQTRYTYEHVHTPRARKHPRPLTPVRGVKEVMIMAYSGDFSYRAARRFAEKKR